MHPALLIDEILRLILYFSSENDRPSLVAAASSCKAWRDPALDFIWNRLSSFKPLLLLLPGSSILNGEYVLENCLSDQDLCVFRAYARRIKHVSNRRELRVRPSAGMESFLKHLDDGAIANLVTAHISVPRCSAMLMGPLHFSCNLARLDVDLGFKLNSSSMDATLCEYLERVAESCHELRHVSVRGNGSERLNGILARMHNLQSISFRLGASLLPNTMKAILNFPRLSELEVHAGHLDFNDLYDTQDDWIRFAPLRKLHIRAQATFIEHIMQHIPPNILQHLHIELDDPSPCAAFWTTCFAAIAKTACTLNHLSLEHHFEIIEPSVSIPLDPTAQFPGSAAIVTVPSSPPTSYMPFEVIKILSNLKFLRHFSCDITLPPTITDQDVGKMTAWWPSLQHFELGLSLQCEGLEDFVRPQMTPGCLLFFAKHCSELQKLILPLTIGNTAIVSLSNLNPIATADKLKSLSISGLTTTTPYDVARFLRSLFPSLHSLEGPCDEGEVWIETVKALRSLGSKDL